MNDLLPPLNALVAFEAAARLGSITRAAGELCVTQAAVSQQIRRLEEFLGLPLFVRDVRGIHPTPDGERYLRGVGSALDSIRDETAALMAGDTAGLLTVVASPSFVNRWLMPRYERFYRRHQAIDLRISPLPVTPELGKGVDIIIYPDLGEQPGAFSFPLLRERVFPLCHPEQTADTADPGAFLRSRLLLRHARNRGDSWEVWLRRCGIAAVGMRFGPLFEFVYMALAAAMDGSGVVLGRTLLTDEDVEAGRLDIPLGLSVPSNWRYWFRCAEAHARRPKIQAFRAWMEEELEQAARLNARLEAGETGPTAFPASRSDAAAI